MKEELKAYPLERVFVFLDAGSKFVAKNSLLLEVELKGGPSVFLELRRVYQLRQRLPSKGCLLSPQWLDDLGLLLRSL